MSFEIVACTIAETGQPDTGVLIVCDVCGVPYLDDDGHKRAFTDRQEAAEWVVGEEGWMVTTTPVVFGPRIHTEFAICVTEDGYDSDHEEHQAARDLLLPPSEAPYPVLDGQTAIAIGPEEDHDTAATGHAIEQNRSAA